MILTPQKELPALGHSFDAWKVTKAATAKEFGERVHICTQCNYSETSRIPKLEQGDNTVLIVAVAFAVMATATVVLSMMLKKRPMTENE